MNVVQIISQKRDGHELSTSELEYLVTGFYSSSAGHSVASYQMSAFAMAVFFRGMSFRETVDLTRIMRDSGRVLEWDLDIPRVDKHSTGGVGDKISIPLAPALAACGLAVPMISGRGLGPTGGTLDKLESIPGFRCDLTIGEFQKVVSEIGCAISGATEQIAPADKKLYELRDVTATVPSIPLVTASILSKKLAEGLDALVMDVKWGTGAFMKTVEQARALAMSLVKVSNALGTSASAIISDMNQPLGKMVGNSVEIQESIDILNGRGPKDVRDLTIGLGAQCLIDSGSQTSLQLATDAIARVLDDGSAMQKFAEMVEAQCGNLKQLPNRERALEITSKHSGLIDRIDAEAIGIAVIEMGGGRQKLGDELNYAVGLESLVQVGDCVDKGKTLFRVFCDNLSPKVEQLLLDAVTINEGGDTGQMVGMGPLIVESVTLENLVDENK